MSQVEALSEPAPDGCLWSTTRRLLSLAKVPVLVNKVFSSYIRLPLRKENLVP